MSDRADEFASQYAPMSRQELLDVAADYDDLTEPAQAALRLEFAGRGMEAPLVDEGEDELQFLERQEIEAAGHDLVTLRQFRDLPEAFVARAVLQQAGIGCFLRDEYTIGMQWTLSNIIGGVRLQVPRKELAAAEAILSQPMPESFAVDSGLDFEQPICPRCGSLDVMGNDTDRKIKAASTILAGLPLVIGLPALAFQRKDVWKCNACDCRWVDDGEPAEPPNTEV